jgi:hypothetical protein
MIRRAAPAAVLLALLAGCGIQPTRVIQAGPPAAIRSHPTLSTLYLVRDGKLVNEDKVFITSPELKDLVLTLFDQDKRVRKDGTTTALRGLTVRDVTPEPYQVNPATKGDPLLPEAERGLRLVVVIDGDRELSTLGLAQITCTAQWRDGIWAVDVVQLSKGRSRTWRDLTCSSYVGLMAKGTRRPLGIVTE